MARRAQSSPDHAGNCDRPRQSDRGQSNLGRPAAARAQGVPAGFVAFEEDPETIKANLAGFTWAAGAGAFDKIQFIDGRGPLQAAMTGSFDLSGLLTQLSELIRRQAPGWIVLDGLDNLLDLPARPDRRIRPRPLLGGEPPGAVSGRRAVGRRAVGGGAARARLCDGAGGAGRLHRLLRGQHAADLRIGPGVSGPVGLLWAVGTGALLWRLARTSGPPT